MVGFQKPSYHQTYLFVMKYSYQAFASKTRWWVGLRMSLACTSIPTSTRTNHLHTSFHCSPPFSPLLSFLLLLSYISSCWLSREVFCKTGTFYDSSPRLTSWISSSYSYATAKLLYRYDWLPPPPTPPFLSKYRCTSWMSLRMPLGYQWWPPALLLGVRGGGCGWSPVVLSMFVDCYSLVWHMPSTTLSKRNQKRRMRWPRRTRWLAADSLTSRSPVASWALVTGGRSPGSWSLETQYPASYLSPSPSCVILPTLSWLLSARIPPLKSVLNCQSHQPWLWNSQWWYSSSYLLACVSVLLTHLSTTGWTSTQ